MAGTELSAAVLLLIALAALSAALLAERHARAARRHAEQRFEDLLAMAPDAVVGVAPSGRIAFVNPQAEALLGYSRSELVGQPLQTLLPEVAAGHAEHIAEYLRHPVKRRMAERRPVMIRQRDGQWCPVEVMLSPTHTPAGLAVTAILRDLRHLKEAEAQLRLQGVALESAANGIVITSRSGEIQWTNPAFTRMTGYSAAEARGQNPRLLKSGRHPPEFYRSIWDTVIAGRIWQGETINRRKDGSLYVEEQTVAPVRDDTGQITHYVAIKQDITTRKQAETAARRRAEDLAALADTMLDINQRRDLDDILESIVRRAGQLLDTDNAFLDLAVPGQEHLQPRVAVGALLASLTSTAEEGLTGEVWRTGRPLVVNDYAAWLGRDAAFNQHPIGAVAGVPLKAGDRLLGVLGVAQAAASQRTFDAEAVAILTQFAQLAAVALDNAQLYATAQHELAERAVAEAGLRQANEQLQGRLAEIEALQHQLREQATRDPLTGLFNRRYLAETLDRELARAARAGGPLSVVVLDVDHFKTVNDTYGHKAGDLVLQSLAELLQTSTRQEDVPCRYGGEEFVLVLGGAPLAAALQRAEAWRRAFASRELVYDAQPIRATISLGVAAFPQHGVTVEALLKAADQALYQAKAGGRNQVVVAEMR